MLVNRGTCCIGCFSHEYLVDLLSASNTKGACDYWGGRHVRVIYVADLYDAFANLLRLYERANGPQGDPLIYLVQEGHEVFSDRVYNSGRAGLLLDDILLSGWDDDSG